MVLAGSNILVIGSSGVAGSVLSRVLERSGARVLKSTRGSPQSAAQNALRLDLSEDMVNWDPGAKLDSAIICAGVTGIRDCHLNPSGSYAVNVKGVLDLSRNLASKGAFIVYISSSQVFDGNKAYPRPEDPVSPITEYGRQKAVAERRLMELEGNVGILRATKALGLHTGLFEDWKKSLKAGMAITPYSHMSMAPVPVGSLVYALCRMLELRLSGVYHLSGDRDMAYSDIAYMLQRAMGADQGLVNPVSDNDLAGEMERQPRRTALNMDKLADAIDWRPPEVDWTLQQAFAAPEILLDAR